MKGTYELSTAFKTLLSSDFQAAKKINALRGQTPEKSDPFVMFEEVWIKREGGFHTHPHRGQATVTFIFDGSIHHKDSNGCEGILGTGDVQLMEAGSGIEHSELTDNTCHACQLWVNLPAAIKKEKSTYQDVRLEDVQSIPIGSAGYARVYSGEVNGVTGPMKCRKPIGMIDLKLSAGEHFAFDIPSANIVFFYLTEEGEVTIARADGDRKSGPFAASLTSSATDGTSTVAFYAKKDSRMLVYYGVPIKEPIVMRGPFVMNTMAEIEKAFYDFQ